MFKAYLKGFLKGLLFLFVIILVIKFFHVFILGEAFSSTNYSVQSNLLFWLFGMLSMSYLIRKYKYPSSWMVASIFLTFFMLPFLFGNVELSKKRSKK